MQGKGEEDWYSIYYLMSLFDVCDMLPATREEEEDGRGYVGELGQVLMVIVR